MSRTPGIIFFAGNIGVIGWELEVHYRLDRLSSRDVGLQNLSRLETTFP
jgi:hypothetical protein